MLARAGLDLVRGEGKGAREGEPERAMFSHGAVFAEVLVDPDLGQVRVSRLIGAFAAGRIVNPRLARSQLLGGMIWGIGMALQEEAVHDARTGRLTNADLAGYHVPVNADVPMIEALTVHEDDPYVNALGIKGVGEIGVTGTVGAIGNAVWHATGVQPARFPIHPESLI
uniref:Aldehyde oxidase/xanthine dehydrogenase second molybdopterin binding domain-containing protein n=1 Tax=Alloyangia mangrovi TaxID=1779329 RepID=A0A2A3JQ11_9RHOB